MWDSRANGDTPMVGLLAGYIGNLTVRVRACPTMEADHDLAMSQPLARLGRMLGRQGPQLSAFL